MNDPVSFVSPLVDETRVKTLKSQTRARLEMQRDVKDGMHTGIWMIEGRVGRLERVDMWMKSGGCRV